MEYREIAEKEKWNAWIIKHSSPSVFLQSWEWGEYQRRLGRSVRRIAAVDRDGNVHVAASFVRMPLLKGRYWLWSPRGPIGLSAEGWAALLAYARSQARTEGVVWWRVEPPVPDYSTKGAQEPCTYGFTRARALVSFSQPRRTVLVNVDREEGDILSTMHQKTRYNIRLAQRKGVHVRFTSNPSSYDIDMLYALLKETARRQSFSVFPKRAYAELFSVQSDDFTAELLFAEFKGDPAAALVLCHFGDTTTYVHGGSSAAFRPYMAPYLLQWEAIRNARARGSRWYDLWGISDASHASWEGITRFKLGFVGKNEKGGRITAYAGAYDVAFQKVWYDTYRAAGILKKVFQGVWKRRY